MRSSCISIAPFTGVPHSRLFSWIKSGLSAISYVMIFDRIALSLTLIVFLYSDGTSIFCIPDAMLLFSSIRFLSKSPMWFGFIDLLILPLTEGPPLDLDLFLFFFLVAFPWLLGLEFLKTSAVASRSFDYWDSPPSSPPTLPSFLPLALRTKFWFFARVKLRLIELFLSGVFALFIVLERRFWFFRLSFIITISDSSSRDWRDFDSSCMLIAPSAYGIKNWCLFSPPFSSVGFIFPVTLLFVWSSLVWV